MADICATSAGRTLICSSDPPEHPASALAISAIDAEEQADRIFFFIIYSATIVMSQIPYAWRPRA
jgi:hypothetical protein